MALFEKSKNLTAPEKLALKIKDIMSNAIKNEHNVIFYGRPGYGKSTIVYNTLVKDMGIPEKDIYIMDFSIGTTESRIKGGINIKTFRDSGQLIYNVEESFMVKPYVIFEEFFDAIPEVLNSLKAILTRGSFIQGTRKVQEIGKDGSPTGKIIEVPNEIKLTTKSIFALTNREPNEIASRDDATEAMVDRFQIRFKVEWETYTKADYQYLVKRFFDEKNIEYDKTFADEMCKIASSISNPKERISPRDFVAIIKEGKEMVIYTKGQDAYKRKVELDIYNKQKEDYLNYLNGLENNLQALKYATSPEQKKTLITRLKADVKSQPLITLESEEVKVLKNKYKNLSEQITTAIVDIK